MNIVIEFKTLGLPAGSTYVVRRTLNGNAYDAQLDWGAGLAGQCNWVVVWGLGQAPAGQNTIGLILDADNAVDETSEADNSATITWMSADSPDPVFINGLGGVPERDWNLGGYVDVLPGPGCQDYRGGSYCYDGHNGNDFGLAAAWEQQYVGTPLYAPYGGIVIDAIDGGGDQCGHPTANNCGSGNAVGIDHGGGWVTWYDHMRNGSIAVRKGDVVSTGQFLGYVGSSGRSSGPHLHWAIYQNWQLVEPYQRANELLADPLPYPGEAPSVMDIYTTLSDHATIDRAERDVFLPDETPAVMINTQGMVEGVDLDVIWYKPNGSEFVRWHTADGAGFVALSYYLSPELGEWTITAEVNGVRQAQTKFLRTASPQPEVKVTHLANNFTQVLDEATTPVLFDPVSPGRPGSTRTITVRNVGARPLSTSDLTIPRGFVLAEGLSPIIDPGTSDTFTLSMDTTTAGLKCGIVSFAANDADEGLFTFAVQGLVTDLALSLSSDSVAENASVGELTGTVTRPAFDLSEPMTVYLSSHDRSEANVPLRVMIPAGEQMASFPVTVIDDAILDGNREVAITASLIGNVSTQAKLTVRDYESLELSLNQSSVRENSGVKAATLTITRSTSSSLRCPLTVTLFSDDLTEIAIRASATIPAGQSSVTVPVDAIDDQLLDGSQLVAIRASANGFVDGSVTVRVDDCESLTVAVAPAAISENGGSATATVTRGNTDTGAALIVVLYGSDTSEITVPASVTIGANQSSVTFPITAVDDRLLDGTQSVTIRASAIGYVDGLATIQVQDCAALLIEVSPTTVSENGGSATGTLLRTNMDIGVALTVSLYSSDRSEATVPATVNIPANGNSVTFPVTGVDDSLLDGTHTVTIRAAAPGYIDGWTTLQIQDFETLSMVISPTTISENGGRATGMVTRSNSDISTALVVNLASSDITAATVPSTVSIPANQKSVAFDITAVADGVLDGTQTVTVQALATGYIGGSNTVEVRDNSAPVLAPLGSKVVEEQSELKFAATASDADLPANELSFSLLDAPAGASINVTTGVFQWTPTESQGPGSYMLRVRVTDNGMPPLSDEEQITITVNEVNMPPVLALLGNKSVEEQSELKFAATASDVDLPANELSFSLLDAPAGASIDVTTGVFQWTPTESQGPGSYMLRVRVTDNRMPPLSDEEQITITVNEVNMPPVLALLGNKSVKEQSELKFAATATDADLPANLLIFSLLGAPAGASIDSATGVFGWTPTEAQGPGSYTFAVRVTDNGSLALSDEEPITITVSEVNSAPTDLTLSNTSVPENQFSGSVVGTFASTDADAPAGPFTYSLVAGTGSTDNGSFTIVDDQLKTNTVFNYETKSSYAIRARISDAGGLWLEKAFTITVLQVNELPTLDPLQDLKILEDAGEITVSLSGISAGGIQQSPLHVTATSSTPALIAHPTVEYASPNSQGTLRFTPVPNAFGVTRFTVVVEDGGTDGNLATPADNRQFERSFDVVVESVQDAPTAQSDAYLPQENQTLTIEAPGVLANDQDLDGDPLQAVLVRAPARGTLELHADGSFSYMPSTNFNREGSFEYYVDDGLAHSAIITVTLTVQTATPWHNGIRPVDVNDDRYVTPLDALLAINELNRGGSRKLPASRTRPLTSPFLDVSRDGHITPLDALLVINYLNSRGQGEGESELSKSDHPFADSASQPRLYTVESTNNITSITNQHGSSTVKASATSTSMVESTDLLFAKLDNAWSRGITNAPDVRRRNSTIDLEDFLEDLLGRQDYDNDQPI